MPEHIKNEKPITGPTPTEGGWLPIESAPKDGTPVLVRNTVGGYTVARWTNHRNGDPVCWRETWKLDPMPTPTHYRPLPDPPTDSSTSETP